MAGLIFLSPGATNFRDFVPGDCNYLKSIERLGATVELFKLIHQGNQDYNRANTALPVPNTTLNFDTETKAISASASFPYTEVTLGVYECQQTIVPYMPVWVTPTTGELAGISNPLDALVKMFKNMNYVAKLVETSALYNSPVGFFDLQDNTTAQSYTLSINTDLIYASDANGNTVIRADNWATIVDNQQALV